MAKICVSITHAKNDLDKATVGLVVANASVASGQETLVFLSIEGVRLAVKGFAEGLQEPGFAPVQDLIASFVKAGGTIFVCSPCMKKRTLDQLPLVEGATIVGGAKLVEFLAAGAACISY
jgi:uncharacterized protein